MSPQRGLFDREAAAESRCTSTTAIGSEAVPAAEVFGGGTEETRREAHRLIHEYEGRMLDAVLSFVQRRGQAGATDEEIRNALGLKGDTARARRCELRDCHVIIDSGKSRPTSSGRRAVVWTSVPGARLPDACGASVTFSPDHSVTSTPPRTAPPPAAVTAADTGSGADPPPPTAARSAGQREGDLEQPEQSGGGNGRVRHRCLWCSRVTWWDRVDGRWRCAECLPRDTE